MKNFFVYGSLLFPEIVLTLTGKTFETAPATAENFYEKREIKVLSNDKKIPAIIYVGKPEFRKYAVGSWSADFFEKNFLKKYVFEIIPKMIKDFENKK